MFLAEMEDGKGGLRSSGFTDSLGRYELRTDAGERGGAVGKYRVLLIDGDNGEPPPARPRRRAKLATASAPEPSAPAAKRVPGEYGDYTKTPLRAEIRSGGQTLNFDIP